MSPFKEPQPRKMVPGAVTPAKNPWPPYARQGGEATWTDREPVALEVPNTPEATQFQEAINEAIGEPTKLEYRTAALEAAVKYVGNQSIEYTAQGTVALADIFENYLKNGKPS